MLKRDPFVNIINHRILVTVSPYPAVSAVLRQVVLHLVSTGSGHQASYRSTSNEGVSGEFDEIRNRLEEIAEELADLAIARLRDSIDAGGTELPVDEKRLTRARRAVEKAITLLREPDDQPYD